MSMRNLTIYTNVLAFSARIFYTGHDKEGIVVNPFEQDVQCKRNNLIDTIVGFIVSFGFFTFLFVLATLIDVFSR